MVSLRTLVQLSMLGAAPPPGVVVAPSVALAESFMAHRLPVLCAPVATCRPAGTRPCCHGPLHREHEAMASSGGNPTIGAARPRDAVTPGDPTSTLTEPAVVIVGERGLVKRTRLRLVVPLIGALAGIMVVPTVASATAQQEQAIVHMAYPSSASLMSGGMRAHSGLIARAWSTTCTCMEWESHYRELRRRSMPHSPTSRRPRSNRVMS